MKHLQIINVPKHAHALEHEDNSALWGRGLQRTLMLDWRRCGERRRHKKM
jgi:hypothetical protein